MRSSSASAASARRPRSSWPPRAWARSRSATPTPSISPTCSGRSCTQRRTSARARSTRPRAASRRSIPRCASSGSRSGSRPPSLRPSLPRADVVLDCCDNFRHAPRGQRGLRSCAQAARLRRRRALRRPDRGVRRARFEGPLLSLPVRRGRRARGDALRDDGRVRAAGGHRRRDAGGRSAEAPRRRGRRR